jgi:hypothetical protein
LGRLGVLEV